MSAGGPSLDDLVRAQRSGVGLSEGQRAANRSRLASRVLVGASVIGTSAAAASTVVGSASGITSWLAKITLGVVLVGSAGAAYVHRNRPAPRAAVAQKAELAAVLSVLPPEPVSTTGSAPEVPSVAAQATVARRAKRSPLPGASAASSSLAVEVQLMHDVDAALKLGEPVRALALLDARREGDAGYMREERAAARVFALCQSGHTGAARAQAARFLRDRPRSPLAARVSATCASPMDSPKPEAPR
jgi:hypothetical protein